jgi:hypothetical protein
MQKILFPLLGLAALTSSASAEPIRMTDNQLDLVVAGLTLTFTEGDQVYHLDTTSTGSNGALALTAEDGTLRVVPLNIPIKQGDVAPGFWTSPEFTELVRALKTSPGLPNSPLVNTRGK